jgi:hypothetical protein
MSANGNTVPAGCYDAGDGYYDPQRNAVCSYETAATIKVPNSRDAEFYMTRSRVGTNKSEDRK